MLLSDTEIQKISLHTANANLNERYHHDLHISFVANMMGLLNMTTHDDNDIPLMTLEVSALIERDLADQQQLVQPYCSSITRNEAEHTRNVYNLVETLVTENIMAEADVIHPTTAVEGDWTIRLLLARAFFRF